MDLKLVRFKSLVLVLVCRHWCIILSFLISLSGSGKTAAYLVSIFDHLKKEELAAGPSTNNRTTTENENAHEDSSPDENSLSALDPMDSILDYELDSDIDAGNRAFFEKLNLL